MYTEHVDILQNTDCCSVAGLCPTLCDPVDWSMPGFPVLHHLLISRSLLKLMSIWWCHPTISFSVVAFSSCLQSFPSSGYFPMSRLFASSGQSIGVSALASVLPMNIQGWFSSGLTGLISLLSKELSRVFSSTTVQRHQFFGLSLFYCPALTSVHDYWRSHSLDCLTFVGKVTSLLFNTLSRRLRFWIIKFHLFLHLKCSSDRAFSFLWELRFLRFKASNPKISKGKKYSLFKIYSTHWNIESLQEAEWIQGYDFINCEMIVE